MGEITGNASAVSIKANLFWCLQEKPKRKWKWGKKNHLTSPSLKAADALKFTRQGLLCGRQWGGEGGCSSAPRDCICKCNFGISCLCSILMQIFGTGSWFCSLAHSWGREPCGWLYRPIVTYQLASDHELLQAAFPADSNTFWHAFLCLEITNRGLPLHPPSSVRSSTQSEVIPPERRHPTAEFAVMAEREMISGSNQGHEPQPSSQCEARAGYFQVCPWKRAYRSAPYIGPASKAPKVIPLPSGTSDQAWKAASSW